MGRIFSTEGPIGSFLGRMTDLIVLNLLTCLCCIPVITAGAAFTALHYMSLKLARNEEGYIVKGYFKSFKQNFRQATILWLIVLLVFAIFAGDWYVIRYTPVTFPKEFTIVLFAAGFVALIVLLYLFPVLAKFENTIANTVKNAAMIAFISFPRAILMILFYLTPVAVALLLPQVLPLVVLMGLSFPAYMSALLYSGVFKKFEPPEEAAPEDTAWTLPEAKDNVHNNTE